MAQTKRKFFSVIVDHDAQAEASQNAVQSQPLSLSDHLRQARDSTGMSLRQVADALRIRYVYLQAIEDGRWSDLPGPVYAIGFIRTLSLFLELDADDMVRRFKAEERTATSRQDLNFPVAAPEARLSGGVMLLVALLLAGVSYGGWYIWSAQNEEPVAASVEFPDRFATMLDDESVSTAPGGSALAAEFPASEPGNTPAEASVADAGAPPSSDRIVTDQASADQASADQPNADQANLAGTELAAAPSVGPAATPSAAPSATAPGPAPQQTVSASAPPLPPAAPEAEASATTTAAVSAGAGVELRATGDSWVLIRDADDSMVMTRVMRAGESYEVPEGSGMTLFTGNAGALTIYVDGEAVPAIGALGEVVRGVPLSPDDLRSFAANR